MKNLAALELIYTILAFCLVTLFAILIKTVQAWLVSRVKEPETFITEEQHQENLRTPPAELVGYLPTNDVNGHPTASADVWRVLRDNTFQMPACSGGKAQHVKAGHYLIRWKDGKVKVYSPAVYKRKLSKRVIPAPALHQPETRRAQAYLRKDLIAKGITKDELRRQVREGKIREGLIRTKTGQLVKGYIVNEPEPATPGQTAPAEAAA